MSDFPKGGDIQATRAWLDKKGFVEVFTGWKADAILGLEKSDVLSAVPDNGLKLWGFLNTARTQQQAGAPQVSPRYPNAVYVLVLKAPDGSIKLVGTGFAVTTPSKTIGMTCAHCIWKTDESGTECKAAGDFYFVSRIERATSGTYIIPRDEGDEVFKMKSVYHSTADICLLQIDQDEGNTSTVFAETIPICPAHEMPRSARDEYEVKVYQSPIAVFASFDLPVLDINVSNWSKATMVQPRFFYTQTLTTPGSSGGPVINKFGKAVGMVQSDYCPQNIVEFASQNKEDNNSDDDTVSEWSCILSNTSSQIATYTKVIKIDGLGHDNYLNLIETL